jgi:hypothetical protein
MHGSSENGSSSFLVISHFVDVVSPSSPKPTNLSVVAVTMFSWF